MKMSLVRRLALLCSTVLLCLAPLADAYGASPLESIKSIGGTLSGKSVDASADIYEYVGENIIARGHVVIKFRDTTVTADKAIININSQDIEAA